MAGDARGRRSRGRWFPEDRHTPAAVLTLSRRPAQERLGRGWVTQRRPVARGRAGTDRAGTGPSSRAPPRRRRAPRASHSPTTRQREPPSAPESLPGNGRPRERLRPESASTLTRLERERAPLPSRSPERWRHLQQRRAPPPAPAGGARGVSRDLAAAGKSCKDVFFFPSKRCALGCCSGDGLQQIFPFL